MAIIEKPTTAEKSVQVQRLATARSFLLRLLFSEYFVLYLSIAYFLALWPFVPVLGTWNNLGNILSNMWPLLAVATGQTFVLIVAGIDLSQTSIMALASVVGAAVMTSTLNPVLFTKSPLWGWVLGPGGGPLANSPVAVPIGILAMLATGALIGFLNGTAITRFRMPAFMVTLVTLIFFDAFAIWLTKSENITNLPQAYNSLDDPFFLFVSPSFLIVGTLAVIAHLLLSRTVFGRWLYAIGTNIKAAIVSGVPTQRAIVLAYVVSGLCAAVASVLYSARLEMGRPTLGQNNLLDIIGATVIGGTSLFGGKGRVIWTVFGVLFFVLLDNTLNLLSLQYYMVTIIKGAVILLAALLDVLRTRLRART